MGLDFWILGGAFHLCVQRGAFDGDFCRLCIASQAIGSIDGLFQVGGIAEVSTMMLGFITMQLLQLWNGGKHQKARVMGLIFGALAVAFWLWLIQTQTLRFFDRPQVVGSLLLPFLWSLLIPLFAFFARPPVM